MKKYLRLYLTGFGMGTADIVPGVSGGTIAFIFGIYEELLHTIKKLSGETLRLLLKAKIAQALKSVPFSFIIPLGLGILSAILLFSRFITYLLANHPVLIWAFFFGLILASIIIVRKRVVTWGTHDIVVFIVAALLAYVIVGAVPVETPATYFAFFISGAIAIMAMILPGLSGSFLLVLMGKYEQILHAVVAQDVVVLGLVMAGAVVGLSLFSRVLTWLFAKHHDVAVAALTGFMLGSLRKVWPWKDVLETRINSKGLEVAVVEQNILPAVDIKFFTAVAVAALGFFLLLKLNSLQVLQEHTEDLEDSKFSKSHTKALRQ